MLPDYDLQITPALAPLSGDLAVCVVLDRAGQFCGALTAAGLAGLGGGWRQCTKAAHARSKTKEVHSIGMAMWVAMAIVVDQITAAACVIRVVWSGVNGVAVCPVCTVCAVCAVCVCVCVHATVPV